LADTASVLITVGNWQTGGVQPVPVGHVAPRLSRRACMADDLSSLRASQRDDDVMSADVAQLARDINARCRLRGRFVLRSGEVSDEYFDKYIFEADPGLLARVTTVMRTLIPEGTDLLGGLELGGIPLVTMLSHATGIPALFVRKRAKTYGTCRLAEGTDPSGRTVVLVEDVITAGGTVIAAARALRQLGAAVSSVVCVIDRTRPTGSGLADEGIAVKSVFTKDLLDSADAGS
jgi:orotate phosphoribosyltransferase